jgi:hypothetical protein
VLATVLLAAGWCGSGSTVGSGPRDSLRAYADALERGRADEAYDMLSNDAKRSVSREAFRRMVEESPEDVEDIARALRRPTSDPVVTAVVHAPNGERLTLIYERGRWAVDGTGIDRYGQATPRQALEGFLRAFDRKRYDVILRYVPNREILGGTSLRWTDPPAAATAGAGEEGAAAPGATIAADAGAPAPADDTGLTVAKLRQAWEGDQKEYISRIVQAIKSALPTAQIEQTEDRAAMPYGAGGTVLFLREEGLWKIEDLK